MTGKLTKDVRTTPIDPNFPYTVDETAEIMGVHRETVKEWFQEGRLVGVKLGYRTLRIQGSDLIDFIHNNRSKANEDEMTEGEMKEFYAKEEKEV